METAVLIWNGNSVSGNQEIQSFLEKLPASDHQIVSLDAQPIHGMFKNYILIMAKFELYFLMMQKKQLKVNLPSWLL